MDLHADFRTQPNNIDAEQAVLGSMMLDKSVISMVIQILTPDDFYDELHQGICKTIYDLCNNNKVVDIITVSNKLPDIGLEYFMRLVDIPTTQNARHYAGIVKGKSIRRQIIKASEDIREMAFDGNYENIIDLKNYAMQKLDIDVKDPQKTQTEIKHIGIKVLNSIEERYQNKLDNKLPYGIS